MEPPFATAATLAALEQATAARLGPYAELVALSGTTRQVVVELLRSTIDLGGWVDLYLLRRAATQAADRVARVKSYDPALGALEPDRSYVSPPTAGELVEVHHLPPDLLRRAVRAGLRRCWMRYRLPLLAADPAHPTAPFVADSGPVDLTAYAPWLRLPQRVVAVVDPAVGAWASVAGATVYGHAGHVWLRLPAGLPNPGLEVVAVRDHFGYVDGADAPAGPTLDAATLELPVEYGAALGAVEAWRIAEDRLEAVAAESRQATRAETAAEATRVAVVYAPWMFVGGRDDRLGPLAGLMGATGAGGLFQHALVNGPAWLLPRPSVGGGLGGGLPG